MESNSAPPSTTIANNASITAPEPSTTDSTSQILLLTLSISVLLATIILILVAIFIYLKYYKASRITLTPTEITNYLQGIVQSSEHSALKRKKNKTADELCHLTSFNKEEYEIKSDSYTIDKANLVREGSFGIKVYTGKLQNNRQSVAVAIKSIERVQNKLQIQALITHLKVLCYLGRNDVVEQLIGANTSALHRGQLEILTTHYPLGTLEKYLLDMRPFYQQQHQESTTVVVAADAAVAAANTESTTTLTTNDLLDYSIQLAHALAYLTSRRVIHADLRCKNLTLDVNKQLKLVDIGFMIELIRNGLQLDENEVDDRWRWMAPELLQQEEEPEVKAHTVQITAAVDIWSYACTVWEIFNLAEKPYVKYGKFKRKFVQDLRQAENPLRLERTNGISKFIYTQILCECWKSNPADRIPFALICKRFGEIVNYPKTLITQTHCANILS